MLDGFETTPKGSSPDFVSYIRINWLLFPLNSSENHKISDKFKEIKKSINLLSRLFMC